jgi:YidC/Oxa1 family membrane protein insertase
MTRSAKDVARTKRRALLLVLTLVALGAALLGALPVAADSPSPSIQPTPVVTPAPTGVAPSPASSPASSPSPNASPCPLPTVTPLPSGAPTPVPGATPAPHALCAANPTDPIGVLAFLFNPIFQTMFLLLTVFYSIFHDVGIAIIILTLIIKTLLIPLFRQQIVSQRRMAMIQPEIKAIAARFKGNRTKINEEQMRLYRERGVNPASGCLPSFLQLFLLLPIYSVISQGLSATNINSALQFLGIPVLQPFACQATGPCIDPNIWWLGNLDAHVSEVIFRLPAGLPLVAGFGISLLAIASALLQLIQSRMMAQRSSDPQVQSQQRIMLFLPLISIVYGSFLPAGLFIYWIVFTAYSIVQQYLIVGWGSLFPLFGWTPAFARDHQPRFPVTPAPPKRDQSGDGRSTNTDSRSAEDRAAGTIRPDRQRARTSRRGRRR